MAEGYLLRLYENGHSKRSIAQTCGISKNTVKKYLRIYKSLNGPWNEFEQLDEKTLGELFAKGPQVPMKPRLEAVHAFFPYLHKELRETGVTRKLWWEEYRQRHPGGYQLTQFCEHYPEGMPLAKSLEQAGQLVHAYRVQGREQNTGGL